MSSIYQKQIKMLL